MREVFEQPEVNDAVPDPAGTDAAVSIPGLQAGQPLHSILQRFRNHVPALYGYRRSGLRSCTGQWVLAILTLLPVLAGLQLYCTHRYGKSFFTLFMVGQPLHPTNRWLLMGILIAVVLGYIFRSAPPSPVSVFRCLGSKAARSLRYDFRQRQQQFHTTFLYPGLFRWQFPLRVLLWLTGGMAIGLLLIGDQPLFAGCAAAFIVLAILLYALLPAGHKGFRIKEDGTVIVKKCFVQHQFRLQECEKAELYGNSRAGTANPFTRLAILVLRQELRAESAEPDHLLFTCTDGRQFVVQIRHLQDKRGNAFEACEAEYFIALLLNKSHFRFEPETPDRPDGNWRAYSSGMRR